jgi:hypothetical protein
VGVDLLNQLPFDGLELLFELFKVGMRWLLALAQHLAIPPHEHSNVLLVHRLNPKPALLPLNKAHPPLNLIAPLYILRIVPVKDTLPSIQINEF